MHLRFESPGALNFILGLARLFKSLGSERVGSGTAFCSLPKSFTALRCVFRELSISSFRVYGNSDAASFFMGRRWVEGACSRKHGGFRNISFVSSARAVVILNPCFLSGLIAIPAIVAMSSK